MFSCLPRPLSLGAAALLAVGACGGGRAGAESDVVATPTARVPPPTRLDSVFVLESSGVPTDDTVVAVSAAERRVIILRRGAPDNSLFAEVAIAASDTTASPGSRDSLRIAIRPRPGLYGIDLTADRALAGPRLTFSYGVHFVAPPGARERYGGDLAFERMLLIARVEPDGRVVFLPTHRPGSDLLSATLPGPGRFVVAAPRP
jgi:hypothetical protein